MARIVMVIGLSGVGKSTVISGAIEKSGKNVEWINFGDVMLETLKETHPRLSRDEIKRLPYDEIKKAQDHVIDILNSKDKLVILDNHMSIESPYGYYPGTTLEQARRLDLVSIVSIEASPESVLQRRLKDTGVRAREHQSVEDIETQMDIDRAMASTLAVTLRVPLKVIRNEDKDIAIGQMARLLGDLDGTK